MVRVNFLYNCNPTGYNNLKFKNSEKTNETHKTY